MKKEFAMLAATYNGSQAVVGKMISRKLNGWGCIWDGGVTRGQLATNVPWYFEGGDKRLTYTVRSTGLWTIGRADKNGIRPKVIEAPKWYLDQLPLDVPLHGELWKDDDLGYVKSVCGQGIDGKYDPRWHNIQYMVYNVKPYVCFPGIASFRGPSNPFWFNEMWERRMDAAKKSVWYSYDNFFNIGQFLKQERIDSQEYFNNYVEHAMNEGWEGAMVVNPLSLYECYRSSALLKVKPEFDIEATVTGYTDGDKRHTGRMGAVSCVLVWDERVVDFTGGRQEFVGREVRFKVGGGFSDGQREWDWVKSTYPIGSQIHFTFLGVSNDAIPFSCNHAKGAV